MMFGKRFATIVAALFPTSLMGATVININALNDVDGTGFATNYAGGIGTGNNVVFTDAAPAVTEGQMASGTTYSAPSVYVAASKNEFTWNFGVANNGGSGWRIRLNGGVTDAGRFFSDNLFAVNDVTFDAANDTLDAGSIFISNMAAVSSATLRFVLRDNGNFYISESSPNFQTGALTGNLSTGFTVEALSVGWFAYNPTVNPANNGVADIGAIADPNTFSSIDFIGFHLEAATAANGTIGAHTGANFGVRTFSALAIPEPSAALLLGAGGIALFLRRRR